MRRFRSHQCVYTTLDRFGAELLAALPAVPATRADELRRALRKSGIAAFGVLAAAKKAASSDPRADARFV